MIMDEVRYTMEQQANNLLQTRGYVFLDEIYDALEFALLKHGLSNDQNIETNREEN